jgi:RimJ/RimL family protein N-acetyltransferase
MLNVHIADMLEDGERIICGDIVLRRHSLEDVDSIVKNINDSFVSRYTIHVPYPYTSKDAYDFLEKNQAWYEEGTSLNLAITKEIDDKVIGGIGLMNIEKKFNHAEIGYWLGKEYWGKGITPRCVQAMVRFGFQRLGLQRISAVVFSPNLRSRRVLEKNGFVHEGTMRDRYVLDGKPVDGEMYAIISRDMPNVTDLTK